MIKMYVTGGKFLCSCHHAGIAVVFSFGKTRRN
jgi:hypothetical protein